MLLLLLPKCLLLSVCVCLYLYRLLGAQIKVLSKHHLFLFLSLEPFDDWQQVYQSGKQIKLEKSK